MKISYDTDGILKLGKKRFAINLLLTLLCICILVSAVVAMVIFNSFWWIFLIFGALVCIALVFLLKLTNELKRFHYSNAKGEIVDVFKDISTHYVIKGSGLGIGVGVRRKYESYNIDSIRITIYIQDGEKIRAYVINGVNEKHVEYYEARGVAVHIFGTRYPLIIDRDAKKWLCPHCGEFNPREEKSCISCKHKILK